MRKRHDRKTPRHLVVRAAAMFVLALAFSVLSFSTVMANTVSANVIDGDKSYTFSMESAELGDILAQAERQGLNSLGPLDVAEQVENTTTVNIRRGVPVTVEDGGKAINLVAYQGDTVAKALQEGSIVVKDGDEVEPGLREQVTPGMRITVLRRCTVTVTADREAHTVAMTGGTVADAIAQAGVALEELDSASYPLEDPLFDGMKIQVSRAMTVLLTVDGETAERRVSARTVEAALPKLGVILGEDDRVEPGLKTRLSEGMEIAVTRAEIREVTETETIPAGTETVYDDERYTDETEVITEGRDGERAATYREVYLDGELETRELLGEETLREPVTQVISVGTRQREGDTPEALTPETPASLTDNGNGFLVDAYGNTIQYTGVLSGVCTAYYPLNPGDLTATGVVAGYGCIAVDPRIIPYGTRLYIVSPDGSVVYGYGTAVDTGGFVNNGVLADLCYDTMAECSIIGAREMLLYILP